MEPIRSFIAIELPRSVQLKLETVTGQLTNPITRPVRWVPGGNIHLTLKFLGDVAPEKMGKIKSLLQELISSQPAFAFRLVGVGAFPSTLRPRIIWVGISAPPQLGQLAKLIDTETAKAGFPSEERPFSPHLTIGRMSRGATPNQIREVGEFIKGQKIGEVDFVEAREVVLFRSDLHPSGAIYSPLLKIPFQV